MSKARDSYRVRQVGHQLPETEVRTIWLFETTPGVSRSKFPVLQHRSGRQEAALQSESQPRKRPLLISFFSAVLWEKKSLQEPDTPVSPARCLPGPLRGQLSARGGDPLPWGGLSRTGTLTAGFASTCLSVTAASWPLLMDLSKNVLVCIPSIHGPPEALLAAKPTVPGISTRMHPCLSFPLHPELSPSAKGEAAKGGLVAGGVPRGAKRWLSPTIYSADEPFQAIQGYCSAVLNCHWFDICKKYCCIAQVYVVKPEGVSHVVVLLQIFSRILENIVIIFI